MNNSKKIENAGMRSYIIPLAGFIIALSIILSAILCAAYLGAFSAPEQIPVKENPVFIDPDAPYAPPSAPEGLNENTLCRIKLINESCMLVNDWVSSIKNKKVLIYSIFVINESDKLEISNPANIEELSCYVYSENKLVEKFTLSDKFTLNRLDSTQMSGRLNVNECDRAVFYVEWSDINGNTGSTVLDVPVYGAPDVYPFDPEPIPEYPVYD